MLTVITSYSMQLILRFTFWKKYPFVPYRGDRATEISVDAGTYKELEGYSNSPDERLGYLYGDGVMGTIK